MTTSIAVERSLYLKNISNSDLISRMEKLVRTERKITHLILAHILEMESRRLYADLGYDGMYTYLTRGLGYSEASAYRRLQAARLLKSVPEISEKIESGALNLSQLTQVQRCLKESVKLSAISVEKDSQAANEQIKAVHVLNILEKLENKNNFETQKVLAQEFDRPLQLHESVRPQKDNSVRLEITLTAEQYAELEKAKSLLSHICPEGSLGEVIAVLAKKYNEKFTKEVSEKSSAQLTPPVLATAESKNEKRKSHSVSINKKRHLLKKSDSCCEYVDTKSGKRCGSKYQLQIDHRHPKSKGGTEAIENLRVLCRTHNLLMAERWGIGNPLWKQNPS